MHDGHDPNALGLFHVNDGIGKFSAKVAVRGRIKLSKAFGMRADVLNKAFHFPVKTRTQVGSDLAVGADGLSQFGVLRDEGHASQTRDLANAGE